MNFASNTAPINITANLKLPSVSVKLPSTKVELPKIPSMHLAAKVNLPSANLSVNTKLPSAIGSIKGSIRVPTLPPLGAGMAGIMDAKVNLSVFKSSTVANLSVKVSAYTPGKSIFGVASKILSARNGVGSAINSATNAVQDVIDSAHGVVAGAHVSVAGTVGGVTGAANIHTGVNLSIPNVSIKFK